MIYDIKVYNFILELFLHLFFPELGRCYIYQLFDFHAESRKYYLFDNKIEFT
jgi:hypothetical protein